ncbi:OLC1v1027794C1 [Oldenlandia corymbosa var. corymbosa]|nr:OLC1v1027794C1 [Oldenlandia corymbosa var. corymbosa]
MVQDLVKKGQNSFKPIHYSYSEIKKITNNFKVKLGVGSCGSIFGGKLRSGPTVAVKMMDKTTASSQEFLRFVAAIGRVDHANVMPLIGFCFEGQNRALVYDLMPNGSIQKYISPKEGDPNSYVSLSIENLYKISLGVARGIDYLHRNCDIQAPHLGFKPHNVLLDENMVPKISDFGLAKVCPGLSNAAPEFYYKSIGEVEHNSDVYSFGMLLVGMINTVKKKTHSTASPESQNDHSSSRIHDQLVEGRDMIEIKDATAEEKMMIKKLMEVASICIQMKPADRPSMSDVVKMLEQEEGEC